MTTASFFPGGKPLGLLKRSFFLLLACVFATSIWQLCSPGNQQSKNGSQLPPAAQSSELAAAYPDSDAAPLTDLQRADLETKPLAETKLPALADALVFQGPAATLRLRVVDASELAIRDAYVEFTYRSRFPAVGIEPEKWYASNTLGFDQDGHLSTMVPVGVPLTLKFQGDLWQKEEVRLEPLAEGETFNLGSVVLTSALQVRGRVLDESGVAIPQAHLFLSEVDAWAKRKEFEWKELSAEDGSFQFSSLPPTELKLQVQAQGFLSQEHHSLDANATRNPVDYILKRGLSASGKVLAADGSPVADAQILLAPMKDCSKSDGEWRFPLQGDWEPATTSMADGSFTVHGFNDRESMLLIAVSAQHGTGYAPNVEAGQSTRIQLTPIVDLRVELTARGDDVRWTRGMLTQRTDGDQKGKRHRGYTREAGLMIFGQLDPGNYDLEIFSELGVIERKGIAIAAKSNTIQIDLPMKDFFQVWVQDEQQQPMIHAEVELFILNSPAPFGTHQFKQFTNDEGAAIFADLKHGAYGFEVFANGYLPFKGEYEMETTPQSPVVVLHKTGNLHVLVVDENNHPVPKLTATLQPQNGQELTNYDLRTDRLGRIVWPDLHPGRYLLDYRGEPRGGRRRSKAAQELTAQEIHIEAGQSQQARIQVLDLAIPTVHVTRNGLDVANAVVLFGWTTPSADGKDFNAYWSLPTDARGRKSLSTVKPGDYWIQVKAHHSSPKHSQQVTLTAGPQVIEIELATGTVRGQFVVSQENLANVRVALVEMEDEGYRKQMVAGGAPKSPIGLRYDDRNETISTTRLNGDGVFEFQDVPTGTWQVRARGEGLGSWQSESFAVRGSVEKHLGSHSLLAGATLSGVLEDYANEVKARVGRYDPIVVQLEKLDGSGNSWAECDSDGRFRFTALPADIYQLKFGDYASDAIEIGEGATYRVDIPQKAE